MSPPIAYELLNEVKEIGNIIFIIFVKLLINLVISTWEYERRRGLDLTFERIELEEEIAYLDNQIEFLKIETEALKAEKKNLMKQIELEMKRLKEMLAEDS